MHTPRSLAIIAAALLLLSCRSATDHRREADRDAARIIAEKQEQALGRREPFTIARPSDALRRRLFEEQGLLISGPEALDAAAFTNHEHWPDDSYDPTDSGRPGPLAGTPLDDGVVLNLDTVLQVAARNSRQYQARKEEVFRRALDLDLQRHDFGVALEATNRSEYRADASGSETTEGLTNTTEIGISRRFTNGSEVSAGLAIDLVQLLGSESASTLGIVADASITIPLLRGSGRHIAGEPLTQAERDVVYALWEFAQFKRSFAVAVAEEYLGVLQQLDQIDNARGNIERVGLAATRSRAFADAGRLPEIQVDQAEQELLAARDRLLQAEVAYEGRLDRFKLTLGLPTDAHIDLDPQDLRDLRGSAIDDNSDPIAAEDAIALALERRLDFRVNTARTQDAARQVWVAADDLRTEITLGGSVRSGASRGLGGADQPSAEVRADKGIFIGFIYIDLPFDRSDERVAYRKRLLDLEGAIRALQEQEDELKLAVRNDLRELAEARERYRLQRAAQAVAERRAESTRLFLRAGRAEMRDLLEAEDALVRAQDAVTAALVDYRLAWLSLQRDLGVLEIEANGLWTEYDFEALTAEEHHDAVDSD